MEQPRQLVPGVLSAVDGIAKAPGICFLNEPSLGFYRSSTATLSFVGGTLSLISSVLALADGTAAAPSLAFSSDTNTGLYSYASDWIGFATNGTFRFGIGSTEVYLPSAMALTWNEDVFLYRISAAVLALKNADTAQEFRVYGATTGTKHLTLKHNGTDAYIGTPSGAGDVYIQTGGANTRFQFGTVNYSTSAFQMYGSSGKDITWSTDGGGNIGAVGATRPDNIYVKTGLACGGVITTGALAITSYSSNGALYISQGTLTDPYYTIQTLVAWNDGADTFTAWRLNVTNTASAATSKLLDLQVGAASVFSVRVGGGIIGARVVTANTAAATPDATLSHSIYTNEGDADGSSVTLPTAVAGLTFTIYVQVAQTITVTANTGDTIRIAGNVTAAAGSITSNVVGSWVTLVAINATEWVAISSGGTWTF